MCNEKAELGAAGGASEVSPPACIYICIYYLTAGEFGIVYKGCYIKTLGESELCAVKTLRGLQQL